MTAVTVDAAPRGRSIAFLTERGMGASVLVAALSTAFGVVLLSTTGYLSALLRAVFGSDGETLALMIPVLSVIFVIIAMYVGAVVTANTFSTIVAGRTRRIALMRLVGASAHAQRAEVARQGLVVGVIGSLTGLVAGVVLSLAGVAVADALLDVPPVEYAVLQPWLALPTIAVVLTPGPRRGPVRAACCRSRRCRRWAARSSAPRSRRAAAGAATSARSRCSSPAARCWASA
jgi:putative ABC transport system permease protein